MNCRQRHWGRVGALSLSPLGLPNDPVTIGSAVTGPDHVMVCARAVADGTGDLYSTRHARLLSPLGQSANKVFGHVSSWGSLISLADPLPSLRFRDSVHV